MRDNEDRVGVHANIESTGGVVANQTNTNSLNFVTPTQIVELPSRGTLYPEGHPLRGKETIEIKFMTAKEEDILTSRSLIKKGVAVDRMLESLIVDKNIKINQLLLGDKNALVVEARISGYGSSYKTSVTCPSCATNVKHEFNLEKVSYYNCDNPESLGAVPTQNGTFIIKLPKTGFEVEVRPLFGSDEIVLSENQEKRKKAGLLEDATTQQMKSYVVAINGIRDPKSVSAAIDNLPAIDARTLRAVYKELMPNIDMTQQFVCPSCAFEQDMEVPFTVDFFWPK